MSITLGAICPRVKRDLVPRRVDDQRRIVQAMSNKARPAAYSAVAKEIGQRILWARELVEPNRAAFARGLGVDRSTIRKIETGERPPSIFAVLALSHQLRVTPDYILIGRMRDVDGELAAELGARHPELRSGAISFGIQRMEPEESTGPEPRKQPRRAKKRRKSS